jgi:acetyl-CoA carboxylase carboxyl transferase beta subunit
MSRLTAWEFIDILVDEGTWTSWDTDLAPVEADPEYAEELALARAKTGLDESVLTGGASIRGHRLAILLCEFGFLGGSIGVAAGDRLTKAIRRATAERLPLLVVPTSGGTRMQEGTTAFLQMVRITAAVVDHKAARLPYLVYLRHPTTGGVFASWGSLGNLTLAEPAALIGFLGPRVYEAMCGHTFPPGVQTAENLCAHGIVDAVCPPDELAGCVADALTVACTPTDQSLVGAVENSDTSDRPAWASVLSSRHPGRPGVRELLRNATHVVELCGTGEGEIDPALKVAMVRFADASCVLLGQDRHAQADAPLGPAALRQARRGIRLATELGLPLVAVIDTAGAELSQAAEEGGMAGEIARCLADMVSVDVPTVSVLLGQGTGGAALALFPADRTIGAAHGWLSPLPPEGASAILHRTTGRAPEVAGRQGIRSVDLLASGALDRVIPEYPDGTMEPESFCIRVTTAIRQEILSLTAQDSATRLSRRTRRFDRLALKPSLSAIGQSA